MRTALVLIVLIVIAFLVINFNGRVAEWKRQEAQAAEVSKQKKIRQETVANLTEKLSEANSPAAVVEYALVNHMVIPGDHPVVVLEGEQVAPESPVFIPEPQQEQSNFEIWLSLFIEPSTP